MSSSHNRRLFDTFLFCNEVDMLELRLLEHDPAVDKFYIVEARKTFTNKDKPLHFDLSKDRFTKWLPKIEYLVINDFPAAHGAWDRESFMRNYALKYIRDIASPDDYILSSDLDEIVSSDLLLSLKNSNLASPRTLEMDLYYYNCDWKKKVKWRRATIGPLSQTPSLQLLRDSTPNFPLIRNAGWHLSYFLTPEQIANKIASFSHTEYNSDRYKSIANILEAIETGRDLFSRGSGEDCIRATDKDKLPSNINILPSIFQRRNT